MKVRIGFYCTKENKAYKVGDQYTGKRTDLKHLLIQPKKKQTKKK